MLSKQEIERFLNGQCDDSERQKIKESLNLQDINLSLPDESDWEKFTTNQKLGIEDSSRMLEVVRSKVDPSVINIASFIKRIVWAAAIIVLVAGTWWIFKGNEDKPAETKMLSNNEKAASSGEWFTKENNSGKPITIVLSDGSTVVLYNKSELRYQKFSGQERRLVELTGEADMKVAKDKMHPFSVAAGGVSVTVLGTVFNVKAEKNSMQVRVRLFEGRILIQTGELISRKDSIILRPGQEYLLDKIANSSIVRLMTAGKAQRKAAAKSQDVINRQAGVNTWIQFDNQPLANVLDQLSELYATKIVYNKSDVNKLYFIGKFEKGDSLSNILETITDLNKLKLQKKSGGGFIISK